MKKHLWIALCLLFGVLNGFAQSFQTKYFKDGMYIFEDQQKFTKTNLFTTHKTDFGLRTNDVMNLTYSVTDSDGKFDCKYEHLYKGIKVEGSSMFAHGYQGVVLRANGRIVKNLNIDTTHTVSDSAALITAMNFIGAVKYIWQDTLLEDTLKYESGDPNATNYPIAELVIAKKRGDTLTDSPSNFARCYKFNIEAINPQSSTIVYVDADANTVFTSQANSEEDYGTTGTGWTWYYGSYSNLKTTTCGFCGNYKSHDLDRNIETWGAGNFYKSSDNDWVRTIEKEGGSMHWALERAWDYYQTRFFREGTDYSKKRVKIHGHATMASPLSNAYWNYDGGYDNITVRADKTSGAISAAALDILAHEYYHGMLHQTSGIGGNKTDLEAVSINEGFSDILGMSAEGYTRGYYDWNFGELGGSYARHFDDPRSDFGLSTPDGASADTYLGTDYVSYGVGDLCYSNEGVWRKWFYLFAHGGTHNSITVTGKGNVRGEGIAYLSSNWWFWANLRHTEAASQLNQAIQWYTRTCSDDHVQMARALRAVGFTNVPIPFCIRVLIVGPRVIDMGTANSGNITFTAPLNDIVNTTGTFTWHIPAGWIATANGGTLTVSHFSDFNSKMLGVTYVSNTQDTSVDSMVVHFSDEPWTPEHSPTASNPFYKLIQDPDFQQPEKIEVFPNPTGEIFNIRFAGADENGLLEITDISGKTVRSTKLTDQVNKIDVSNMPNGLYLLRIQHNHNQKVEKITVIH